MHSAIVAIDVVGRELVRPGNVAIDVGDPIPSLIYPRIVVFAIDVVGNPNPSLIHPLIGVSLLELTFYFPFFYSFL